MFKDRATKRDSPRDGVLANDVGVAADTADRGRHNIINLCDSCPIQA